MASIWSALAAVAEPRRGNARRHKLLDILTISLVATICGAETCVDIADFARDREALFREFLDLPGGMPSHDTYSRLFRLLDPAAFAACFAAFLDDLGADGASVLAIDGKTLRRSFDRAAGRSALHVVTAEPPVVAGAASAPAATAMRRLYLLRGDLALAWAWLRLAWARGKFRLACWFSRTTPEEVARRRRLRELLGHR